MKDKKDTLKKFVEETFGQERSFAYNCWFIIFLLIVAKSKLHMYAFGRIQLRSTQMKKAATLELELRRRSMRVCQSQSTSQQQWRQFRRTFVCAP